MNVKIYIKDNTSGTVHGYGTNPYDALILQEDGSLHYENLQNGTGTIHPEEGYTFCNEDGTDPRTDEETVAHSAEPYIDIGGEGVDLTCDACKWHNKRHQKCSCCRENKDLKSNYEPERLVFE